MPKVYKTSDLALSAFLQARGHKIVDARNEGSRGVFVFADSEELRQNLLSWANNEPVSIAVRAFVNGMRDLKGMVSAA